MCSFLTLYTLASLNFTLPVSEYVTSYISVANVTAKLVKFLHEANHGCTVATRQWKCFSRYQYRNSITKKWNVDNTWKKNDLVSGKTKKHPSGRTNKRLLTK